VPRATAARSRTATPKAKETPAEAAAKKAKEAAAPPPPTLSEKLRDVQLEALVALERKFDKPGADDDDEEKAAVGKEVAAAGKPVVTEAASYAATAQGGAGTIAIAETTKGVAGGTFTLTLGAQTTAALAWNANAAAVQKQYIYLRIPRYAYHRQLILFSSPRLSN
jgi:hypothetical protein